VAYHLRPDFHLVELLARIDADDAANHFRHHNHVPQMCLDQVGLLVGFRILLGLAELPNQAQRSPLEAAIEPTAGACVHHIAQLFGGEIEESMNTWLGAALSQ
jgi:hypothetical protein